VSIVQIPPPLSPFYQQTTVLESVQYVLSYAWNQRCSAWYLSIADANSVDIYNGMKLICNMGLLFKCSDPRKPPGQLYVVSSTNDVSPPGLQDLATGSGRCSLRYVTSDWLAQIKAGNAAALIAQSLTGAQPGTQSTYGAR
jgi:hypothetical protein